MLIEPNTTVHLLKNVPLDPEYTDTIYFNNEIAQETYFISLDKISFFQNTYQRVNRNKIRLQVKADDIYNCNYMMFKNYNYGNKWFYAFVTQINYINDNVSEIEYELDVLQSWFFEYELEPSYVEREHSSTDVIGEHIAGEPVDLGPIKCDGTVSSTKFDEYVVLLFIADQDINSGDDSDDSGEDVDEDWRFW